MWSAKVSDRLIKDKRPFSDRIADVLKEFINSKKPENIHFNAPLIKSDELKSILKSLDPSKSRGIDGISPKMLKLASDVLLPSLLQIINIGLHTGVFPDVLKEARVFPIHKGGPSEDPSNYRPISILPIVSKVIEKTCHQAFICLSEQVQAFTWSSVRFPETSFLSNCTD